MDAEAVRVPAPRAGGQGRAGGSLKLGVTFKALDAVALAESDIQAAKRVATTRDSHARPILRMVCRRLTINGRPPSPISNGKPLWGGVLFWSSSLSCWLAGLWMLRRWLVM